VTVADADADAEAEAEAEAEAVKLRTWWRTLTSPARDGVMVTSVDVAAVLVARKASLLAPRRPRFP